MHPKGCVSPVDEVATGLRRLATERRSFVIDPGGRIRRPVRAARRADTEAAAAARRAPPTAARGSPCASAAFAAGSARVP
jgi:hypothetical protein